MYVDKALVLKALAIPHHPSLATKIKKVFALIIKHLSSTLGHKLTQVRNEQLSNIN